MVKKKVISTASRNTKAAKPSKPRTAMTKGSSIQRRTVKAGPTKAFFVRMLTRDIALADAILDLLDNCVDGIQRQLKRKPDGRAKTRPYKGYWARIAATPGGFAIRDNCGGIPRDTAENYAFMFGRLDSEIDSDIPTVGMYGIGMKRAIFKMGYEARVRCQTAEDSYEVQIPKDWLEDKRRANWNLDLDYIEPFLDYTGTEVEITSLYENIAAQFDDENSDFLSDLSNEISRHFALILDKGFEIYLNDVPIKPVKFSILAPETFSSSDKPTVEPYVFSAAWQGVDVDFIVGFYRPLFTEGELNNDILMRSTRDHAGWTIVCNDRIVAYNDKTFMTGWGQGGVPGFHNQFISIAGLLVFRSNDSMKLPLNTTKRGIDRSSQLYNVVLGYMQDAMKKFTSFTNQWKSDPESAEAYFEHLTPITPFAALARATSQLRKVPGHDKLGTARRYIPDLPTPSTKRTTVRIGFVVERSECEILSEWYFGKKDRAPSEVGERSFREALEEAKEA